MTKTTVSQVSLYLDSCVMTRTARIHLEKGPQTVILTGLGQSVDQDSLRLNVPAGVEGSNVQMEYLTKEQKEERCADLKKKIKTLERQLTSLAEQAELWKTNADFSARNNAAAGEITSYLEQLPERLEAIAARSDELTEEKDALAKELKKELEDAGLPFVTAELNAAEAGEYPLQLRYRDWSASWSPSYEIHTQDEDSDALSLRLRGRLRQSSGEDWKQARLTLYTGSPSVSGTIPQLRPNHVSFEPERPKMRNAMLGAGAAKMTMAMGAAPMAMEDACVTEEAEQVSFSEVTFGAGTAKQGDTMMEYELSGRWDIRNGQEILCDIEENRIPCRYHIVAVPKLSDNAYLAAEIKTSDLSDLQDIPAAVYLKGTFAGNVVLSPDMAEENYDLSLGIDETVKVKRTQKKKYTSNVLLKGQTKTEYEYELSVSSRKEKACDVTLRDQLPISDDKSINVDAGELSGGKSEEKTGLIRWDFPLAAGESKKVTLSYTIAWPRDKKIWESSR